MILIVVNGVATKSVGGRCRWVPLVSAVLTFLAMWLTFGAAAVVIPISLALTVLAIRRSADVLRDLVVTLGLAANGLLAVLFVATVAIVLYDVVVG